MFSQNKTKTFGFCFSYFKVLSYLSWFLCVDGIECLKDTSYTTVCLSLFDDKDPLSGSDDDDHAIGDVMEGGLLCLDQMACHHLTISPCDLLSIST